MTVTNRTWRDIRHHDAHTGLRAQPFGPTVWILENNGKMYGVWQSRHDALKGRVQLANTNCDREEWWTPIPIPVGAVRMDDVIMRHEVRYLD